MDLRNLRSKKIFNSTHPLINFELEAYYQNEPRFNGVFSRDNLPNKMRGGAYIITLGKYSDIRTHWVPLHVSNETLTYCNCFGVEHIQKEIKKFFDNKNIATNIFRMQAYNSVMFGYFCIGFIDFMFNGNSLTDFTNIFSPTDFKRNDEIILN